MAEYGAFFSYTASAWDAMVRNPSDREAAVRTVAEALGGSLKSFYWMFGNFDGMAVVELPDSISAAAMSVAVGSSGALKAIELHELIPPAGFTAVLEKASAGRARFSSPGQ